MARKVEKFVKVELYSTDDEGDWYIVAAYCKGIKAIIVRPGQHEPMKFEDARAFASAVATMFKFRYVD